MNEKRTLKWIDPKFQRQYAFLLLALVLIVSAVLIATFWFHTEGVLATLSDAGILKRHSLYILVDKQMKSLLLSVSLVVLLFSVGVLAVARILSHRIVGPIFAIKRSLERIAAGDYEAARVHLRSQDEFHDVADLVNQVVDRLES